MSDGTRRTSGRLSGNARIALGVFCVAVMAYSFVIAGQILLGVLICALVVTAVLAYQLVGAFYRFVDAAERIAAALESREGGERTRRASRADRSDDSRGRVRDEATDERSRDHVEDRW